MKTNLSATVAVAALSLVPLTSWAQANDWFAEVLIGATINPVPLDLDGKNGIERMSIYRGSYVVNGATGCTGCHHDGHFLPGGDPFLGQPEAINTATYLGIGDAFGPFIARNLTPDASGRPGGLTWEQFLQTMRSGTDLKSLPPHVAGVPGLLQVMPWPEYRHMTTETLRAIYDYLSVIPCVEGGPGQPPNRCVP
jgi:hypothetical protein